MKGVCNCNTVYSLLCLSVCVCVSMPLRLICYRCRSIRIRRTALSASNVQKIRPAYIFFLNFIWQKRPRDHVSRVIEWMNTSHATRRMMRIIRSGLVPPSNTKCCDPHIKPALSNLFYSTNVRCGYSSFFGGETLTKTCLKRQKQ